LHDAIQVAQDVVVPETQHAVAFAFQEGSSSLIHGAFGVLTAVSFDDQPAVLAYKVGNERADGLLAAKLGVSELVIAQC
jgi:hypothetical protein